MRSSFLALACHQDELIDLDFLRLVPTLTKDEGTKFFPMGEQFRGPGHAKWAPITGHKAKVP